MVKYSEDATAKILKEIVKFLKDNASEEDLNRLFGLSHHEQGKKYVDIIRKCRLYWVQKK